MRHQNIYNRLRRIEGQIRGIEEMISKERPEEEILIQLDAARSAVAGTATTLIESMLDAGNFESVTLNRRQINALLRAAKKS